MANIKESLSVYDKRSKLRKLLNFKLDSFLYENKDSLRYPTREIPEGSLASYYGRHALCGIVINEKVYIYFYPMTVDNPFISGKKMQTFSSVSIVDWSSGTPKELYHLHINDEKDIDVFLSELEKYL